MNKSTVDNNKLRKKDRHKKDRIPKLVRYPDDVLTELIKESDRLSFNTNDIIVNGSKIILYKLKSLKPGDKLPDI